MARQMEVLNGLDVAKTQRTLLEQLFFGWLGDKLGRKEVYRMTLMLMVISVIGSGLSFGSMAKSVMATLCFFGFWLVVGIGGDYLLSAKIMSEYANKKTRGAFITSSLRTVQGGALSSTSSVSSCSSPSVLEAVSSSSAL